MRQACTLSEKIDLMKCVDPIREAREKIREAQAILEKAKFSSNPASVQLLFMARIPVVMAEQQLTNFIEGWYDHD